jgi:hypothetical protein
MTFFPGEDNQIMCAECHSIVEDIDDEFCEKCEGHFCLGCFGGHLCTGSALSGKPNE